MPDKMCYLNCYETADVNLKLVRLTNPTVGIYFAKLMEILANVQRKGKADPVTGMWTLDRRYMESETGIDSAEQKNCEEILTKLGIVMSDQTKPNRLAVNMKRYTEILLDSAIPESDFLSKTAKMTHMERQIVKKIGIKNRIMNLWKENILPTDPEYKPVKDLVDVYYDKGVNKDAQWKSVFRIIHSAVTDAESLKEMIDFVIATNYASIPAAIDSFMKKQQAISLGEQKKSDGKLFDMDF